MREQSEELLRIARMLRDTLKSTIFTRNFMPTRTRNYYEWFQKLSEERKQEVLSTWMFCIDQLEGELWDMLEIANGEDYVVESNEESA